jgi:serine/threonine-protein kinase
MNPANDGDPLEVTDQMSNPESALQSAVDVDETLIQIHSHATKASESLTNGRSGLGENSVIGKMIAGYEILGILGRGGMGIVYKARHTGLDRIVALKILHAGANANGEDLTRFKAEAKAIAQIQHPNVIQVYDVGESEGLSYIATEYAGGGDLSTWMAGKPLSVLTAARLVYTLARAVGAAHKKGIVHRDLKPANVLLTEEKMPKIADFGLAKQLGEGTQTTTGTILGTPYYMSPEQASGQSKRVGPASDVYSLGVILYQCLAGKVPFIGASTLDTLDQVRFVPPVPVQEIRPDVPLPLALVVRRCLEKAPEQRYRSAEELADALARAVSVKGSGRSGSLGWLLWVIGTVAALALAWFIARESGLVSDLQKVLR